MSSARLRVVIVEDEPWARERLRFILATRADVRLVGEAADASAARSLLLNKPVDLVLLDIHLPDLDAFKLIEGVGAAAMPAVIFVTAFDQFAVEAFRLHALDYILKPFDAERVHSALDHAMTTVERWGRDKLAERLDDLAAKLRSRRRYPERLTVRSAGRIVLVSTADIAWLDAAGESCWIHTVQAERHRLRRPIGEVEAQLDPRLFLRIHRSTIVNVDQILELVLNDSGDYTAVLAGGQRLAISRSYRSQLEGFL